MLEKRNNFRREETYNFAFSIYLKVHTDFLHKTSNSKTHLIKNRKGFYSIQFLDYLSHIFQLLGKIFFGSLISGFRRSLDINLSVKWVNIVENNFSKKSGVAFCYRFKIPLGFLSEFPVNAVMDRSTFCLNDKFQLVF